MFNCLGIIISFKINVLISGSVSDQFRSFSITRIGIQTLTLLIDIFKSIKVVYSKLLSSIDVMN